MITKVIIFHAVVVLVCFFLFILLQSFNQLLCTSAFRIADRNQVVISTAPSFWNTAHSKVLLIRAYLKVIFHENIGFSFILDSNRPNQMPHGIKEKFWTPKGAQGMHRGCPRGMHRVLNLGSQREQITALNLHSKLVIFAQFGPSLA